MGLEELHAILKIRVPTPAEVRQFDSPELWASLVQGNTLRAEKKRHFAEGMQQYCASAEWNPEPLRKHLETRGITQVDDITTHAGTKRTEYGKLGRSLGRVFGWSETDAGPEARQVLVARGVFSVDLSDYVDSGSIISKALSNRRNPASEYFLPWVPRTIREKNYQTAAPAVRSYLQMHNARHLGHILGPLNIKLARLYGILKENNPDNRRKVGNSARKILIASNTLPSAITEYSPEIEEDICEQTLRKVRNGGTPSPAIEYFRAEAETVSAHVASHNRRRLRSSAAFAQYLDKPFDSTERNRKYYARLADLIRK